jgi:hypothetical protein
MIPLFRRFFKSLFYDEASAAKWIRSFLLWAGAMATSVLAFPFSVVQAWTKAEWAYRFMAAGVIGFAGLISVGQKNQTPEQIAQELEAYKAQQGNTPPAP